MVVVDEPWLHERGGLHDARLLGLRREGDVVVLSIKDEWWGLEGSPEYPCQSPVDLVIERGIVAAAPPQNDWIFNVELRDGGLLITFNDGEQLVITGKGVFASPGRSPNPPP